MTGFFLVSGAINIHMAEISTEAETTPKLDLDSYRLAEYEADLKAKYVKNNDALFKETREWCEEWYCPTADQMGDIPILTSVVAHIKKALNALLNLAMTAVYTLLDALTSTLVAVVGPMAKLVDEVLVFMCYMGIFIANLFISDPKAKFSYSKSCCGSSAFLQIIVDFVQTICDGAVDIYKKMLKIYYQLLGLYEKMSYACECQRIYAETYQEELDAAKQQYGEQYDYVITTGSAPKLVEIGAVADSNTGVMPEGGPKPKYYIEVKKKKPAVSQRFKQHVEYTVLAYNKWPYGADGFCPLRLATYSISFVTWMSYVAILVSQWLSSSNIVSASNPNGYSSEEHCAQMDYCKDNMPKELYNYVLRCVADTQKIDQDFTVEEG